MLIVRLKQCETALADGRLDEAFELVRPPDVRAHRRGQELIGKLVRALVGRGREHLAAGQLVAAAQDGAKAQQLGGNVPDVAQLQAAVSHAMSEQRRGAQLQEQVIAAARRHADAGQLTLGANLIAASPAVDSRADLLRQDLIARRAAVQAAVEKASAALKSDDWESAIEHLALLDRGGRTEASVKELGKKINELVVGRATSEFQAGRLDRAGSMLSRLERAPTRSAEADDLRQSLAQARDAADRIGRSDYAGAEQIVRALGSLWPGAAWLAEAREQLRAIRDASDEVRAGPLGMGRGRANHEVRMMPPPLPNRAPARQESGAPINCVLHVDGVGAFRVIGRSAVTLGPVSSSRPVDLALMVDASLPAIVISRSDDDYFLQSPRPVMVNDKPVTAKLLAHGDCIALGPRCRITFRRPSAASTSAVLDLSGTRLPGSDVRQVILLDRELIVGPGVSSHVRADDLTTPMVIHRRDGRLVCRGEAGSTELSPGVHVSLGSIGLVVAREGAGA